MTDSENFCCLHIQKCKELANTRSLESNNSPDPKFLPNKIDYQPKHQERKQQLWPPIVNVRSSIVSLVRWRNLLFLCELDAGPVILQVTIPGNLFNSSSICYQCTNPAPKKSNHCLTSNVNSICKSSLTTDTSALLGCTPICPNQLPQKKSTSGKSFTTVV
jgi:hypothetical protein